MPRKNTAKKTSRNDSLEKIEEPLACKSMRGPDAGGAVFGLADLTIGGHPEMDVDVVLSCPELLAVSGAPSPAESVLPFVAAVGRANPRSESRAGPLNSGKLSSGWNGPALVRATRTSAAFP